MADVLKRILQYAGERPELELREVAPPIEPRYRVFSVDDHFVEPGGIFRKRMPERYQDAAPELVRDDDGRQWWEFPTERVPFLGADAIRGWKKGRGYLGPVDFSEINPATWDPQARIASMDQAGIASSLNYPSAPFGFAGRRLVVPNDPGLSAAIVRAYNDWVYEEWVEPHGDRFIFSQLVPLTDVGAGVEEIRRNAARGCRSLTFTENPELLGLPSIHSDHWDPLFEVCVETGTIVNLHVGSSSQTIVPSQDSPGAVLGALFPINAMATAADWIFSSIFTRFPELKIVLSEAGIGWVPLLLDRLTYMRRQLDYGPQFGDVGPEDVLLRNFWFATFSDKITMRMRDVVGVENIVVEVDYPHSDSSWPETQDVIADNLADLTTQEIDAITFDNADALYRG